MKTFKDIREIVGILVYLPLVDSTPPTTGHEKLIEKVASVAKANRAIPFYIFASHSENPKKNFINIY